ncbi:MAG: flagellar motor protein MotA [Myxococcales bacterium]|nr:flagellar motor protein MotA [Myxococcales bacterium]
MNAILDQVLFYVERGGFVMPPLLLGAAALWYGLGYRLLTLRRGWGAALTTMVRRYQAGSGPSPRGIIDAAVLKGVEIKGQRPPDLREHLDEAFIDLEADMSAFSGLVTAVVMAAPLTGLLGTVNGMIETFDALGDMALFSQSGGIAGGISEALFSTQMGLAVAIPGLIVGKLLDRRQEALETELARLKDILCGHAS